MKDLTQLTMTHVISEPGDATRYDYAYYRLGDEFHFIPIGNTFTYPQVVSIWAMSDEDASELATKYGCNIHTVHECFRTIKDILGEADATS